MLRISVNNEESWKDEQRGKYYSFSEGFNNQDLKNTIKQGRGMLCAKYSGPECSLGRRKPEPDLDNILLYNMKLATSGFSIVKLKKEISDSYSDIEYAYEISQTDIGEEVKKINSCTYDIDTCEDGLRFNGPATVANFYNIFRGWITNKKNLPTYDNKSRLELVVEYNSRHSLSEGGLIKHSIDGIISALQRIDNIDTQVLRRKGIDYSNQALAILNGSNAAYYNNDRIIWNPQDYLVEKAIFVKNNQEERGYFRVRIRKLTNPEQRTETTKKS